VGRAQDPGPHRHRSGYAQSRQPRNPGALRDRRHGPTGRGGLCHHRAVRRRDGRRAGSGRMCGTPTPARQPPPSYPHRLPRRSQTAAAMRTRRGAPTAPRSMCSRATPAHLHLGLVRR
jgi:hypothetical protein